MDSKSDTSKLDRIIEETVRNREAREKDYRARALKMYPWVCGRCAREFTRANLVELTVHHRDHNHDNNPEDGSNWELLCVFCHDNEHSRYVEQTQFGGRAKTAPASQASTFKAFADLKDLLKKGE